MLRASFQLLCQVKGVPVPAPVVQKVSLCMWLTALLGAAWLGYLSHLFMSLLELCSAFTGAYRQLLSYKPYLAFCIVLLLYLSFATWHGRAIETNLRGQKALILTVSSFLQHRSIDKSIFNKFANL